MQNVLLHIGILIFVTGVAIAQIPLSTNSPGAIRLGMVAPLTGDFAAYGQDIRRGIELALDSDELKSVPEHITVTYENACLPAQAVVAAKKMVEVDRIQAVVGSYCVIGMVPMVLTLSVPLCLHFIHRRSRPNWRRLGRICSLQLLGHPLIH